MVHSLFAALILALVAVTLGQLDHSVCTPLPYVPGTTDGNANGAPCVFPFTYNGRQYNICIEDNHVTLWCSTTPDYDNDKQWGNCIATTSGTASGHTCVFPFIYNGTSYNKCITLDHDKPWCATTSNYDKDLKYGECPTYTARELPKLPDIFTAKIHWSLLSSQMSLYLEEFFDALHNKASVRVTGWRGPGIRSLFIANYDTEEFFTIKDFDLDKPDDTNCMVSELSTADLFVFPFNHSSDGLDVLMPAISAFKFGKEMATVYVGRETLNDINLERWEACVYSPDSNNATFKFTYYFTDKDNWDTSSDVTQVPYRIVLSGKDNNGAIDQVYDFAYFGGKIFDENIFLSPQMTICMSRKVTKQPPQIPDYFSFSMETINPSLELVTNVDEWYDYKSGYVRMDYIPFPTTQLAKPPNKIKVVNDFNTGLSYIIDTEVGNCTVSSIPPGEFDDFQMGPNITRIRNAKEFFSLDTYPVYYKGQRKERGVLTDVFVSERAYPSDYAPEGTAIWEYYFLADDFVETIDGELERSPIVKILVNIPFLQVGNQIIYNLYNFNENTPNYEIFDVSPCFVGGEKRYFSFKLKGQYEGNIDRNLKYFQYFVLAAIETSTGVRQIRLQNLQIDYDITYVYGQFVMIGPITKIKGDVTNPQTQVPLETAASLLEKDINSGNFTIMMTINFEVEDSTWLPAVPFSLHENIRLANGTWTSKRFSPQTGTTSGMSTRAVTSESTSQQQLTTSVTDSTSQQQLTTSVSSSVTDSTKKPKTVYTSHKLKPAIPATTPIACPTAPGKDPTANSQIQPSPNDASTLSTSEIAGIGVGAAVGGCLIGAIVMFFVMTIMKRRHYDLDKSVLTMNEITQHTFES